MLLSFGILPTRVSRIANLLAMLLLCGCERMAPHESDSNAMPRIESRNARVGVVIVGADAMKKRIVSLAPALKHEFRRHGWEVEVVPLTCEPSASQCIARKVNAARDSGVSVFITLSTHTSQAVKTIAGIQAVFTSRADPTSFGLAESHLRPGGKFTGVFLGGDTLHARRLHLLRQTLSKGARVAVVADTDWIADAMRHDFVSSNARTEELSLVFWKVDDLDDLARLEPRLSTIDAFYVPVTTSTALFGDQVLKLVIKSKKSAIFSSRDLFDRGAPMSYHFDEATVDSQLASFARKIATGEKASQLPLESPKRIEFALNIGVLASAVSAIPPQLLYAANITK